MLNKKPNELSGGQQQRLCIARALAVEPEVLLMDEPCSALDPIATTRIEDLMRELREDLSIVIVTHNMQQAARVSDRTAFSHWARPGLACWWNMTKPNVSLPPLQTIAPSPTSPDDLDKE